MKLQQYLLNYYLHIPFEDFSHRAVAAVGILRTVLYNPLSDMNDGQKKKIEESIKKVQEIIDTTNDMTQVSLFILDRNILPQDNMKNYTNTITKFTRRQKVSNQETITLTQDQIQSLLCYSAMQINDILMREISAYSDQFYFEEGGDL